MKNLIVSIVVLAFTCFNTKTLEAKNRSKTKFDSLICLQIEGKILNAEDGSDEVCTIELISVDNVIDTIVLPEGRSKFKFSLTKDTQYGIRISKVGYITKLICINTEIITGSEDLYKFVFQTHLIKEVALKRLNKDVVDFPVALISFDTDRDGFFHNEAYTASIKKELLKPNTTKEITRVVNITKSLAAN